MKRLPGPWSVRTHPAPSCSGRVITYVSALTDRGLRDPRATVLKLCSARVLLTPPLSVCNTWARSKDVPGAEALGHMRPDLPKHRTA
jgi:hypothetical protein